MRAYLGLALLALPLLAAANVRSASDDLRQLFDDERAALWKDDPLSATFDGIHFADDQLPSVTPAAQAKRLQADQEFVKRLHAIAQNTLTTEEKVSYDLFDFMVSQRATLAAYKEWRIPLNSDSGFHADLLFMHEGMTFKTVADYENYLARLKQIPRYFNENIANMRTGLHDGFTLPAEILGGVATVIAGEQFAKAEDCPLYKPFVTVPAGFSAAVRTRLQAAGRAAIQNSVMPAYANFQKFFNQEYRPRARKTIGASALPDGKKYYADLVRYYTTTPDATVEDVHATGLAEVARIHSEMLAIIDELKFQGDFAAFLQFLRTDSQFYATTPEQLLREAAWLAKQVDGQLPKFFGRLPRTPYGVRAVPEQLAPNYTSGRYNGGALGSAGEYWVNTYQLNTRPLYLLPALTLHEAVPGHHLQGSLARELTDVPRFRTSFYPHAFGEGWGLYSEKLGEEIGLYKTPYQRFGRLSYEMWRACRLVVDTGMHSMGWTRQQAVDYLTQNTSLSDHEIRTEVDRYIAWPGQALAYKMGELKILELRHRAEQELGDKFDIRAFHDAVLGHGGVTLPVLEKQIAAYIGSEQAGRPKK
jgi:uncharacterized protein (DUF885 family)